MKSISDCYTLSNGLQIPCMGFGTYNEKDGDNLEINRIAIQTGYRYFDTASLYETERVLGQAVKESGIPREQFFIVSKLWIDERGYQEAKSALERTLSRLQMDYLDLYLIHWPRGAEGDTDWKEKDLETWRALEELYEEGKIKGLGLSNFLPHHLSNILDHCKIKPLVDQLEIHPGYTQEAAVRYCQENDILVQAWSPLGRSAMLENPVLKLFADKYQKSVAQICLRFLLQKGIVPLVKSSTAERMRQNQDIFTFEITEEDMSVINNMPQNAWLGEHPDFAIPKRKSNFLQ
ncbi:aldo/keto reductase [Lachnospiraceae bacterium JLR.KK008]